MNVFKGLLNFASEPLTEWQRRKTIKVEANAELKKLDHAAKVAAATARLEHAKKGQLINFDLDQQAMNNMQKSWKDELVLIVFLLPMIMAFIPGTAQAVLAGFNIIKQMPEWYVAIIIGMVIVIYGLRGLLTKYLERGGLLAKAKPEQKQRR